MSDVVKTIKLKTPVINGSETIEKLEFKALTGKMIGKLKVSAQQSIEDWYPVASRATGQPLHIFEMMSAPDVMEVVGYLGEALADGPVTGDKPSA